MPTGVGQKRFPMAGTAYLSYALSSEPYGDHFLIYYDRPKRDKEAYYFGRNFAWSSVPIPLDRLEFFDHRHVAIAESKGLYIITHTGAVSEIKLPNQLFETTYHKQFKRTGWKWQVESLVVGDYNNCQCWKP